MTPKHTSNTREYDIELAMKDAMEIACLYTALVNPAHFPLLAVGAIMAAMHAPDIVQHTRKYSKELLLNAVRVYAEECHNCDPNRRYRNYNFFGKGIYRRYIDKNSGMHRGYTKT